MRRQWARFSGLLDSLLMKTKTEDSTIGIDLGDKSHAICVLDSQGERVEERTMTNRKESLKRLSLKYPSATIAFEVGSHSPWISRWLTELGHRVYVANPRKLRAIYENDRKSDERDAWMLARLARVDPSLLHPIELGTESAQRDLLQIKLRKLNGYNHAPEAIRSSRPRVRMEARIPYSLYSKPPPKRRSGIAKLKF